MGRIYKYMKWGIIKTIEQLKFLNSNGFKYDIHMINIKH